MNTQPIPWTEKHRPKKFEDFVGQNQALEKVKLFVKYFGTGRGKKALVLHGTPGTGKTTLAHVVANETNSEIFELNASDFRNKAKIQEILKPAIQQQSLTKKGKIILIDEADGISGYYDRGGIIELLSLIATTKYPVIVTANDIWSKKLSSLRQKSELVKMNDIEYNIVKDVLLKILRKEDLFVNENILSSIASRAKGDLRAAINDLQSVARLQDPSLFVLDEREKETDIFNALKQVFKTMPTNGTLRIFDQVDMNMDELILWLEENISKEYSGKELERAYELLAKVDVFRGRIYKQQYWRFMVYENAFMTFGISSVKKAPNAKFTSYKKPTRILKIWMNNQRTAKKKSIAQKYAKAVHVGEKRAMHEFPTIKQIIKSNSQIQQQLKLSQDEIDYLRR